MLWTCWQQYARNSRPAFQCQIPRIGNVQSWDYQYADPALLTIVRIYKLYLLAYVILVLFSVPNSQYWECLVLGLACLGNSVPVFQSHIPGIENVQSWD